MAVATYAEKKRLLEQHFLLGRLKSEEIDHLLAFSRIEGYRAGHEIFAKGEAGNSMMAVLKGRVKIGSLSPDGKEIVLNTIGQGEVFGEIALLDGKDRTADAVAITDCQLLVLSRRDFLPLLERHADICILLLGVLCERLRRTSEQVEDMLFRHLEARLAKTLLRLANQGGKTVHGELRINLKISQRELGNLAGGTRESINKHLQAWRKRGFISVDEGFIIIKDVASLEQLA